MSDAVPVEPLAAWLRATVAGWPDGSIEVRRIAGGHSNLTYRITDSAGGRWALRRPPTGLVLATAHDMSREWRFLQALAPTPVPGRAAGRLLRRSRGDRGRVLRDGIRRRGRAR